MQNDHVKIIHRYWSGNTIPRTYAEYGEEWKRLNPDWEVILWDEDSLSDFPELGPVFDKMYEIDAGRNGVELHTQIADVFGYAVVEKHGGFYANCDIQPLKPLNTLDLHTSWASYENDEDGRVVNAAIYAPQPHDEFWVGLLKGLPERYFADPEAEMVETTGPAYLTDYYLAQPEMLHVYPKNTFNPIHWKQINPGEDASGFDYPEESVGVHHWGHKKSLRSNKVSTATQQNHEGTGF